MSLKILLLHGAVGNAVQLTKLQKYLQKNFQVFVYTFPGHEPNSNFSGNFGIEVFADGLYEFVKQHSLQNALVIGYSMGGYVALYLQSINPLFSGIITLGTKFHWNKETSVKEAAMLNTQSIEEKVPHYAAMLKSVFGDEYWKTILFKTAEMMIALGDKPILKGDNLSTIKIPVIICRGGSDKMVSYEECILLCSYIKDSRYIEFENTPHPIEKLNVEDIGNVLSYFAP